MCVCAVCNIYIGESYYGNEMNLSATKLMLLSFTAAAAAVIVIATMAYVCSSLFSLVFIAQMQHIDFVMELFS